MRNISYVFGNIVYFEYYKKDLLDDNITYHVDNLFLLESLHLIEKILYSDWEKRTIQM